MRAIFVGALVIFMAGICLGQMDGTVQPAQNSQVQKDSGTKELFVPLAPKTDFEARLQQMIKEGRLKPGQIKDFRDYLSADEFPSVILPSYCFTMRTYTFSTQADGSAPRLKGVSTCTPGSNYQLREAKPDVKFYPPQKDDTPQ